MGYVGAGRQLQGGGGSMEGRRGGKKGEGLELVMYFELTHLHGYHKF